MRPLLESTKEELPGHHVLEYRRAAHEETEPRPMYSQVSLQGCHQSLMPSYRLPQSVGSIRILDEVGIADGALVSVLVASADSDFGLELEPA